MSIRPSIAQLGLFLCILGLPAALSYNENPSILDTAVLEPLATVKENAQDIGLPHNIVTVPLVALGGISEETEKCKYRGSRCYRGEECCNGRCHSFAHRCVL